MSAANGNALSNMTRFVMALPPVLFIVILMGGPMLIMIFVSLVERAPAGGVEWNAFSTRAYRNFFWEESLMGGVEFNTDYLRIFLRSALLSLLTVVMTFIIGFPTAMFIAMRAPHRRNLWIFLLSLPFWVNLLVRNYAWLLLLRANGLLDQTLIGIGLADAPLGLLYTDTAVAIGLSYSFLPLMVLPIYAALERFDFSLVEAAFDLGAARLKAIWYVIIPGVKSGIAAGVLLVFIPGLGAYVTPVLLGGSKTMMIGNLIETQFGAARDWPFGAALAFILLLIVALLALLRHLLGTRRAEV